MSSIYLDYAAATPMHPEVLEAMGPYFSEQFYNPSAIYLAGRASRKALEEARVSVARLLGSRPAEIIFTSGATEANNLAITGAYQKFPGAEILVGAIEHDSVLAPAENAGAKQIPVLKSGQIDLVWLAKNISSKTLLISVGLVNNEIGTLQPLREISTLIKKTRQARQKAKNQLPLYLHTDAAQAANFFDLNVARLGVDLMSLNGGKIYGPKQSGVLYISSKASIAPQIVGGGQEFGLRSGTENLPQDVGFAKALELAAASRKSESVRVEKLRQEFIEAVQEISKAVQINGDQKHHSPHILNLTFAGHDNERLMMQLDEAGIACAVGSACSAGRGEPSHVLSAIGLSGTLARSTLRFSFGAQTSSQDIAKAVKTLAKFL